MIIRTPMKPTIVAPHLLTPTNSLNTRTANNVAKRALEKLIAVASARGRCTIAVNPVTIANIDTVHRARCSFNLFVRKVPGNSFVRTGVSMRKRNICLRNRISKTGSRCPVNFIPVTITVANNPPNNNQMEPRALPGKLSQDAMMCLICLFFTNKFAQMLSTL